MSEYVIILLAAAAVTYILTPAVRRFAIAVGALHAARERDVHELPTPLLGGFAIYGGLIVALLVASRLSGLNSVFTETNMAKGLLLAGGLVVIMGFVDDRWGMGALSKLAGQVAAGVILVWSGAEIPWLPAPGGVTIVLTSDQQVAVTILVVVVTMNAVNFIDGLDGLAAGIVGIGALAFFAYYFTLVHRLGLLDQSEPALVSVILAGVCIGFLPHNFYPARIFMGDTGSMLIGLMLAYAPISSLALLDPASLTDNAAYAAGTVNRYGAFIPLVVPAAILLIPYADLLMAVVRRTRAGKSVFAPDKKHLQHRLLAIGHSHRTSVLIMYLWAALFSGTVILLSIVRTPLFVLAIVTVVAVLLLLLVTMPRLRPWSRFTNGDSAAARRAPRTAGAAPARVTRASGRPGSAAGTAAAVSGPLRATRADVAPAAEAARGSAAGAGRAPAGPAAADHGAAPARSVPAQSAPARSAPGQSAPGQSAPARSAPAESAPARSAHAQPVRPAGAGVVQVPDTTPGDAARAAIRARLEESAKAHAGTANGAAPGNGSGGNSSGGNGASGHGPSGHGTGNNETGGNGTGGNGTGGYGAVPASGRARRDDAASPQTPGATPEDESGAPVTHATGSGGWSWDAADAPPPRSDGWSWEAADAPPPRSGWSRDVADAPPPRSDQAVPPWAADDTRPVRSAPIGGGGRDAAPADDARATPPWAAGRSTGSPQPASSVHSWDAGNAAPSGTDSLAAGRSVPPWELPPEERFATPPWAAERPMGSPEPASPAPSWDAGHAASSGAGSLAAGRSVPPWQLPPEERAAPPRPPTAQPRRPATPAQPPSSSPWP